MLLRTTWSMSSSGLATALITRIACGYAKTPPAVVRASTPRPMAVLERERTNVARDRRQSDGHRHRTVGVAGDWVAFFLPRVLGVARDLTGSYAPGLAFFVSIFVLGTVVLLELGTRSTTRWSNGAVERLRSLLLPHRHLMAVGDRAA